MSPSQAYPIDALLPPPGSAASPREAKERTTNLLLLLLRSLRLRSTPRQRRLQHIEESHRSQINAIQLSAAD